MRVTGIVLAVTQTAPSPAAMKRGAASTGISAITSFFAGWMTVTRFFSVLETHTRPNPKIAVKEPGATLICALTELVVGSMRVTMPFGSLGSHADPAPNAIPPSLLAGETGIFATT